MDPIQKYKKEKPVEYQLYWPTFVVYRNSILEDNCQWIGDGL